MRSLALSAVALLASVLPTSAYAFPVTVEGTVELSAQGIVFPYDVSLVLQANGTHTGIIDSPVTGGPRAVQGTWSISRGVVQIFTQGFVPLRGRPNAGCISEQYTLVTPPLLVGVGLDPMTDVSVMICAVP